STVGDKIKGAIGAAVQADPTLRTPANQQLLRKVAGTVQNDSNILARVDPKIAHPFKVGFADSMDLIFLFAAIVMCIGFLVRLLMPPVELRAQSASAAAAAEAGDAAVTAPPEPVGVTAGGQPRHAA